MTTLARLHFPNGLSEDVLAISKSAGINPNILLEHVQSWLDAYAHGEELSSTVMRAIGFWTVTFSLQEQLPATLLVELELLGYMHT